MLLLDKNGVEIRTGDIVRVTGSYVKSDNRVYFVDCSPGDPCWTGIDYSLLALNSKTGELSQAKYRYAFWPLQTFCDSAKLRREAEAWNRDHAQIEVIYSVNVQHVLDYFIDLVGKAEKHIEIQSRYADDNGDWIRKDVDYALLERNKAVVARLRSEVVQHDDVLIAPRKPAEKSNETKEEKKPMNAIKQLSFAASNGGQYIISQAQHDAPVTALITGEHGERQAAYEIPAGVFVQLLNLYRYVKRYNLQDDFINPNGDGIIDDDGSLTTLDGSEPEKPGKLYTALGQDGDGGYHFFKRIIDLDAAGDPVADFEREIDDRMRTAGGSLVAVWPESQVVERA